MSAPDLVLINAHVVTLDRARPAARAVAMSGGVITWIGDAPPSSSTMRTIDCGGATILPGFIDPHCHPLALGAALGAVDCAPPGARTIGDIQRRIAATARSSPPGSWIKAFGYDELRLAERRHPNRLDLDAATANHPVRLTHGSGHAVVLNSLALERVGISSGTPEPPGGAIEREAETGEPSGLLLEMGEYIAARLPRPGPEDISASAGRASQAFVAAGITSVADAGAANDSARSALYRDLRAAGRFAPRVTVMTGAGEELSVGVDMEGVRTGASKIVLTMTGQSFHPDRAILREALEQAARSGRQVAVHAVEAETVREAASAMIEAADSRTRRRLRWRIEHASHCRADTVELVLRSGAIVVTQPGFIAVRGDRYLAAADHGGPAPSELYPIRSLVRRGIAVAASSDAPSGPVSPLAGMQAAVLRRTSDGGRIAAAEAISAADALELYGPGAAFAQFEEGDRGVISPRMAADLVLIDSDPRMAPPEKIGAIRVLKTFIAGRQIWPAE